MAGVGLGGSVEKLFFYLPEAHTDFLLAVIAEELGLVGVVVVVALFFWLVWRAFAIGRQAVALDKNFAGLVAQGIGIWFGVQSFINMGVNMGLLPTKGLTLPLMSFGGSGILANCLALALLLRVDYENRQAMRGTRRMSRTILIMAAGTGGHVFPALAVADALRTRGWNVVWLGTKRGMEARLVPQRGFDLESVRFSPACADKG